MPCTKTGAHIFFSQYGEYGYGDAYEVAGIAYFKLSALARQPIHKNIIHYTVHETDMRQKVAAPCIVEIAIATRFQSYGHEGITLEEWRKR